MAKKHVLAKEPYHILAKPGDVSDRVLAVGDPGRASRISKLLKNPRLVNENRGYLVYTGSFGGERVTIATHGIGAPSAAIVFEELVMLGAKTIVRLGTCGGLKEEYKPGTVVVPYGAAYQPGGTIGMYVGGVYLPAVPDIALATKILSQLRSDGVESRLGLAASSDAFHAEAEMASRWAAMGVDVVEMECATLFILSRIKGFASAAALILLDNLATGEMLDRTTKERLEVEVAGSILRVLASWRGSTQC